MTGRQARDRCVESVDENAAVHVLVAPGAFPGVPAPEAARALARGWASRAAGSVAVRAMSDGAADLLETVAGIRGGTRVSLTVRGPDGDPVPASVLLLEPGVGPGGGTVLVQADQAIGRHLVAPGGRAATSLRGSSEGVGDLLIGALQTGARRIVVGLGGSAVHDAGAGVLRALGAALTGARGVAGPSLDVDVAGLAELRARLAARDLVLACADDVPLLGLRGAGFALARGGAVEPAAAQERDRAVGAFVDAVERRVRADPAVRRSLPLALADPPRGPVARAPFSGAGGGVAALLAVLGGRLLDGARVVADLVDLGGAVEGADLVVTGAARLDGDALRVGVVFAVAAAGARRGVPVVAVAPQVEVTRRELAGTGVVGAYDLDPRPGPYGPRVDPGRGTAVGRLEAMGARLATTWSQQRGGPA